MLNPLNGFSSKVLVDTICVKYDKILAKTGHGLYTMRMIEYLKSEWRGLADIELTRLNRKESDLIKTAA